MATFDVVTRMAARMTRLGTETAFDVLARTQRMRAEGRPVINLGIGSPDFRTADDIVEAGVDALHDGYHFYTAAKGLPKLRTAVAEDIRARHNVPANPGHVLIVPGGKPTLFFALLMLGEPGAEIMYPAYFPPK